MQPDDRPAARPTRAEYRRNLPHLQVHGKALFVTFCTLDRRELPPTARDLVLQHCLHDNRRKMWAHGLIVMPDHVHMVFTPLEDPDGRVYGMEEVVGAIKGASSHTVNRLLERRGQLWQDESFDHVLRSHESVREKVEYICRNPVRKGLVAEPDDYPWLWREWVEGTEG